MVPDSVDLVLQLDGLAERERHRRRAQAQLSRIAQPDQRTVLPDQCLHSAEADVRPPRRKSGFEPEPEMSTVHQSSSVPEQLTVKEGDPRGITFSFDFDVRDCSDGAEHC